MFVNTSVLIFGVFLCFFCSNTISNKLKSPKIVGGRDAVAGEAPYQVSLQYLSDELIYLCGGSIICDRWIVTAGHCVSWIKGQELQNVIARYGSLQWQTGGNFIYLEKVILHEKYAADSESTNYDIALLKTNETMILGTKLSDKIKLACKGSDPKPGAAVTTTGFGFTEDKGSISPNLKIVTTHVVERSVCNSDYGNYTSFGITEQMFCEGEPSGGKGACRGDSGGPVVINKRLEGIVSWSWDICVDSRHPNVNTRVGVFIDWIKEKVGTDCCL